MKRDNYLAFRREGWAWGWNWEFGIGEVLLWGTVRKYEAWNDIEQRYPGLQNQGINSPVKKHLKLEKR